MLKLSSSSAFTMVELIFVIVILGILAGVAIPRLVAMRDDAEVAKSAQQLMCGASEVAEYAMSKGKTEDNLSQMSNALASLESHGDLIVNLTNKKGVLSIGTVNDCVTIQVVTGGGDENLTIAFGDPQGDYKCIELQKSIKENKFPMKLRGKYVLY